MLAFVVLALILLLLWFFCYNVLGILYTRCFLPSMGSIPVSHPLGILLGILVHWPTESSSTLVFVSCVVGGSSKTCLVTELVIEQHGWMQVVMIPFRKAL